MPRSSIKTRKQVTIEELEGFLDLVARLMARAGDQAVLLVPIWRALQREMRALQEPAIIVNAALTRLAQKDNSAPDREDPKRMTSNAHDPLHQITDELRARVILEVMNSTTSAGRANDRVLGAYLDALALGGLPEMVRNTLNRMEALGLLRTHKVDSYVVCALTELGERVAEGKHTVEGVARFVRD